MVVQERARKITKTLVWCEGVTMQTMLDMEVGSGWISRYSIDW